MPSFADLPVELRLQILTLAATHRGVFWKPITPSLDIVALACSDRSLFSVYQAHRTELRTKALTVELRDVPILWLEALVAINNATYSPGNDYAEPRFTTLAEYDAARIIRNVLDGKFVRRVGGLSAMRFIAEDQDYWLVGDQYSAEHKAGIFYYSILRHCRYKWLSTSERPRKELEEILFELLDITARPRETDSIRWHWWHDIERRGLDIGGIEGGYGMDDEIIDKRIPAFWMNLVLRGNTVREEERVKALLDILPWKD